MHLEHSRRYLFEMQSLVVSAIKLFFNDKPELSRKIPKLNLYTRVSFFFYEAEEAKEPSSSSNNAWSAKHSI